MRLWNLQKWGSQPSLSGSLDLEPVGFSNLFKKGPQSIPQKKDFPVTSELQTCRGDFEHFVGVTNPSSSDIGETKKALHKLFLYTVPSNTSVSSRAGLAVLLL